VLRGLVAIFVTAALLLPTAATAKLTRPEAALLNAMNRARARNGLGPLTVDGRLERVARGHTREMLATNTFAHGSFVQRMTQFDAIFSVMGENLAWGAGPRGTAGVIVAAWLASPEHRANLLDPAFSRVGVGASVGTFLGTTGAHVVTADFAG
jgi:uncharacterized protein YkwD